jgi:steroid 5-alpha reductase family enzyme
LREASRPAKPASGTVAALAGRASSMIESVWGLLLVGILVASVSMAALWMLAVRIKDASHVDVAWAMLIATCALLYALLGDGDAAHRVFAAVLASIWGYRLGLYLLFNRVLGKEEDGRYQELRRRWAPHEDRNFFVFFQAQAAFVVFFSIPYAFVAQDGGGLGVLEWAGAAVWAIGNVGVVVSDWQLAQWRGNPANKGKTARGGLWSWSRHPNYFFEFVTWCGVALVATAAPWGWISWAVPAGLLFLLFRITGIPATEAQALRSREDYAEYQRTTSVFVPLPPKR